MKNYIFVLFLFLTKPIVAQTTYDIEIGKPYLLNGIEYGFEIRNEQKKNIKKEDYERFEINAYISNKSGCTKLLLPNQTLFGLDYQDVLAEFDCVNATGKRLSAKSAKVRAREFNAPFTYTTKGADGKDVKNNVRVKVGNILRNNETMYQNFTVLLPSGERPKMRVRVIPMDEI